MTNASDVGKVPVVSDMSRLQTSIDATTFLEMRMENNGDGNPIYIGYNKTPNAGTAVQSWFIIKITYSGTSVVRKQLPTRGVVFKYAWDDRASIF